MESRNPNGQNKSPLGRPVRLLACSGSLDGGGSERQLWQLVSRLDRGRFAPQVYLMHKRGPYLQQLPGDIPVHAFDVDCPAPASFPPGHISRLQSRHLRRLVRSESIDLVYDRTFHMSLLTGWALPASQPRVSVIVSPPSRDLPATEKRFLFIKRWMLSQAYRTATATVCVSHEVADDAATYYRMPRERLTVIPNPVDIETVNQLAQQSKPLARAADEFHIAIIGRFTAEKGHRQAIEILQAIHQLPQDQQLRSVHLHCVGDGPLKEEVQASVRQAGLNQFVHFHGYQTNPYPYMAASDLILVPSRYEGFPNVALESLALGVPLLMSDYGPTARELAGENNQRAMLIPPADINTAVRNIVDCMQNQSAWRARAAVAKAWIEREHALGPWLEKMMQHLETWSAKPQP